MKNLGYEAFQFFLCLIESIILYSFLKGYCKQRINNPIIRILLLLGTGTMIYMKKLFTFTILEGVLYSVVTLLIYEIIQFRMEQWKYIVYVGIYFLVCWICDFMMVEFFCSMYDDVTISNMTSRPTLWYHGAIMSKVLMFAILKSISIVEKKTEKVAFSKNNLLILVGTLFMTFISLYELEYLMRYGNISIADQKIDKLVCIIAICMFCINIIVYWAIKQLNARTQKEKDYLLIQYQNELLIKSIKENQAIESEWHKIRHDFNNHISCIDMLLQMRNIDRARDYIQGLTKNSEVKNINVHIGNEIADAVVNQKLIQAKNHEIEMLVEGKLPSCMHMEDVDLCALLSNSLDNAIEAVCKIEDVSKRHMKLAITSEANRIQIEVSNTVKEGTIFQDTLITTKKDTKRHGIGMQSMQAVVHKYKGSLNWQYTQGIFLLRIQLPI